MRAADDCREFKTALINIGVMLSVGAAFMLLSFLVPGISKRTQILCWQTAMVAFFAAAVIFRRHPVVWPPLIFRLPGLRNKKPSTTVPPSSGY
ncbi:hypothetical protein ACP4OV_025566 [Aristida adscensionis]